MPLVKRYTTEILFEGTPAIPGQPGGEYWFLPPPPPGYQYRPDPAPSGWSPLERIPDDGCKSTPTLMPVPPNFREGGSIALPHGCYAAGLHRDGNKILGIWVRCTCRKTPTYTGVPQGASPVVFSGYSTHPNGHPIGDGPFEGTVTIDGVVKKTIWQRRGGDGALVGGNAAGGVMLVVKTPATPPRRARPPVTRENYFYGWNAGANSKKRLDGDVEAQWRVDAFGAATGFTADGAKVAGDYKQLSHAWYIDTDGRGFMRATPMEFGQRVGTSRRCTPNTKFGLKRTSGVVSYLMDGTVEHISALPSFGRLQLSTALFRGKDRVI